MNQQLKNSSRRVLRVASGKCQAGFTLMETMIGLALSVVVTSAMVALMANSLGTATRVIHMSQLTDELRNAMSMMTRDVRRANYSAHSLFCYGNSECGAEGGAAEQVDDIQIHQINDTPDCFTFTLDRGSDGNAANDAAGGFRRIASDGIGVIEMWTGDQDDTPNCTVDAGWIELTDPGTVNVTEFQVLRNDDPSFEKEFVESETSSYTSLQREIQIRMVGRLVLEEARNSVIVEREIWDTIYVRNDFIEIPL